MRRIISIYWAWIVRHFFVDLINWEACDCFVWIGNTRKCLLMDRGVHNYSYWYSICFFLMKSDFRGVDLHFWNEQNINNKQKASRPAVGTHSWAGRRGGGGWLLLFEEIHLRLFCCSELMTFSVVLPKSSVLCAERLLYERRVEARFHFSTNSRLYRFMSSSHSAQPCRIDHKNRAKIAFQIE